MYERQEVYVETSYAAKRVSAIVFASFTTSSTILLT